jgi:chemotaxis protein methyltransferase CheR
MVEVEGAFVYRRPMTPLSPRAPGSGPRTMTIGSLSAVGSRAADTASAASLSGLKSQAPVSTLALHPNSSLAVLPSTRALQKTLDASKQPTEKVPATAKAPEAFPAAAPLATGSEPPRKSMEMSSAGGEPRVSCPRGR